MNRKMDDTHLDSLDELYQHAKFREDRATRAGCRCENVVFDKHHIFAPTAYTLYDLPETLHGDRARQGYQDGCHPFFDSMHSF